MYNVPEKKVRPTPPTLTQTSSNTKNPTPPNPTQQIQESRWTNHTSRIYSLSFSPSGTHLASGSLDASIYVWSIAKPLQSVAVRHAHPGGVRSVEWLAADPGKGEGKVVSAGADAVVRVWEVKLPGV